jgi:hypothetical protein
MQMVVMIRFIMLRLIMLSIIMLRVIMMGVVIFEKILKMKKFKKKSYEKLHKRSFINMHLVNKTSMVITTHSHPSPTFAKNARDHSY